MKTKQLEVLNRVHDFLGVLIRENLIKDAPFLEEEPMLQVSDLADDVYDAIHNFPLRNCDVGTPSERTARYVAFCDSHANCADCPCNKIGGDCGFSWGDMPYEEGGAE